MRDMDPRKHSTCELDLPFIIFIECGGTYTDHQIMEWFDMRGYMRRHIAVKTLRDGVTNIVDGNYVMGLEQVTRAIKSDPRTLINRGVGFVYPRDADRFLKTFISRGHL